MFGKMFGIIQHAWKMRFNPVYLELYIMMVNRAAEMLSEAIEHDIIYGTGDPIDMPFGVINVQMP